MRTTLFVRGSIFRSSPDGVLADPEPALAEGEMVDVAPEDRETLLHAARRRVEALDPGTRVERTVADPDGACADGDLACQIGLDSVHREREAVHDLVHRRVDAEEGRRVPARDPDRPLPERDPAGLYPEADRGDHLPVRGSIRITSPSDETLHSEPAREAHELGVAQRDRARDLAASLARSRRSSRPLRALAPSLSRRASVRRRARSRRRPVRASSVPTSARRLRRTRPPRRAVECRILAEDRLLELAELRARLDPELLERAGVRVSAYTRSASACRPDRYSASMSCPRRRSRSGWPRRQRLELRHKCVVSPEPELRVDALLRRDEPQLVEPLDLPTGELLVRQIAERGAPPEPSASSSTASASAGLPAGVRALPPLEQPLEPDERRPVPARLRARSRRFGSRSAAPAERLPQPRDLDVEAVSSPARTRRSGQSASSRTSRETTSLRGSNRRASSARVFAPPSATTLPPLTASTGPRVGTPYASLPRARADASTVPRERRERAERFPRGRVRTVAPCPTNTLSAAGSFE